MADTAEASQKNAHTPGPWSVRGDGYDTADYVMGRDVLVHGGKEDRIIAVCHSYRRDDRISRLSNARLIAAAPDLLAFLTSIVDEFGGTIAQYHKIGPDFTFKDGTEVFEVSVVLGRASLLDEARAAIARATEGV